MGWLGDSQRVKDALSACKAQRDEQGRYLIKGSIATMGAEDCVSDDAQCMVDGEWVNLVPLLHGGIQVTVI
jgi:hypothetical protein